MVLSYSLAGPVNWLGHVGALLMYHVLGTNSLAEPVPLQVNNWFEFQSFQTDLFDLERYAP